MTLGSVLNLNSQNQTYKQTFKTQYIGNLGPLLFINMLSSEFFFFPLATFKIILRSNPHIFISLVFFSANI